MLPHIIWNTPNIAEYAPAIIDVLGSICVNHFVHRSLPADIWYAHKSMFNTCCSGENGAGGETRTPNRPITNRVLYQLSHASECSLFSRVYRRVNTLDSVKIVKHRISVGGHLSFRCN